MIKTTSTMDDALQYCIIAVPELYLVGDWEYDAHTFIQHAASRNAPCGSVKPILSVNAHAHAQNIL
jgi:hypothetical protein